MYIELSLSALLSLCARNSTGSAGRRLIRGQFSNLYALASKRKQSQLVVRHTWAAFRPYIYNIITLLLSWRGVCFINDSSSLIIHGWLRLAEKALDASHQIKQIFNRAWLKWAVIIINYRTNSHRHLQHICVSLFHFAAQDTIYFPALGEMIYKLANCMRILSVCATYLTIVARRLGLVFTVIPTKVCSDHTMARRGKVIKKMPQSGLKDGHSHSIPAEKRHSNLCEPLCDLIYFEHFQASHDLWFTRCVCDAFIIQTSYLISVIIVSGFTRKLRVRKSLSV